MASTELQAIVRFRSHDDGALEEFKRLPAACMEIVRAKDGGTLQYDILVEDVAAITQTLARQWRFEPTGPSSARPTPG